MCLLLPGLADLLSRNVLPELKLCVLNSESVPKSGRALSSDLLYIVIEFRIDATYVNMLSLL
jgi:hypothetical protein